jgi:hypothetical protein
MYKQADETTGAKLINAGSSKNIVNAIKNKPKNWADAVPSISQKDYRPLLGRDASSRERVDLSSNNPGDKMTPDPRADLQLNNVGLYSRVGRNLIDTMRTGIRNNFPGANKVIPKQPGAITRTLGDALPSVAGTLIDPNLGAIIADTQAYGNNQYRKLIEAAKQQKILDEEYKKLRRLDGNAVKVAP